LALIEVADLTFSYGACPAIDGVNLSIEAGERVAILGANGSGKTTLAHWLAGWLPSNGAEATRGEVVCRGRAWQEWPLAERASFVQYVGQIPLQQLSGQAFTVRDEIAFGPENLALPEAEVRERTAACLAKCGLEKLASRDPFTLSGGEQQRLVLASALAMRPQVIVLDEPVTNLDPAGCSDVLRLLDSLPASTTMIFLDSFPRVAVGIARRFLFLQNGRITLDGSAADVLLHPDAISTLGLPNASEAAWLAKESGAWNSVAPIPFSIDSAIAAFRQVENAAR
jgi:energy-coupling factor transporter ATP-binding protein EcfA2